MLKKALFIMAGMALSGNSFVHAQDLIQIADTQTWSTFDEGGFGPGVTLQILAGGHLTITQRCAVDNARHLIIEDGGCLQMNARLDTNSKGQITLNGGEFHNTVDFKFPDSKGDQDVHIWLNGGLMVCEKVESITDRGSTLHIGGGVFRVGNTTSGSRFDPETADWTIEVIPPYDNLTIADIGNGWKEVSATSPWAISAYLPENRATDVPRDVVLTWTPSQSAHTHDVYFSVDFNDVNDGVALVSPGQDANSFDPGRLEFGQTYFWRVDEVNAPPDLTVFEGDVWSFTVEPFARTMTADRITATASSSLNADVGPQKSVDGSGLNDADQHDATGANMWTSTVNQDPPIWIQYEFDRVYELHQMWVWNSNNALEPLVGLGIKTATIECSIDGATWTALANVPEFAQAPGTEDYAHNTTVDFGGVAAKFVKITITSNWGGLGQYALSEVRFFTIPVVAREPHPDTGATGVPLDTTLSWRPGREADVHQVHFGTDSNAVASGAALLDAVPASTYSVGSLDLGTTYYWKIDEVNEAEAPGVWEGNLWNFTTTEYLVVDDFESYGSDESHELFNTWIDGYNIPDNGSQAGHNLPPYVEQGEAYSGDQSMPLYYGKDGATHSEVSRTFDPAQDWTRGGITTLVLFFQGEAANTSEELFVKINGTKVSYSGDAGDLAAGEWKQWTIALPAGANLGSVETLTIGVSGGQGMLYIDDVQLK